MKHAAFKPDKDPTVLGTNVTSYRQDAHAGLDNIIDTTDGAGEYWTVCQDTGRKFRLTYCEVTNEMHICPNCQGTGFEIDIPQGATVFQKNNPDQS